MKRKEKVIDAGDFQAGKEIPTEELIRQLSQKDDFDFCILICHWKGRALSFHTGAKNKSFHDIAIGVSDSIRGFLKGAIKEESSIRKCRVCGCTDDDGSVCFARTGRMCFWVYEDICSACVERVFDDSPPDGN